MTWVIGTVGIMGFTLGAVVAIFGLGTIAGLWNEKSLDTARSTWVVFGSVIAFMGFIVALVGGVLVWSTLRKIQQLPSDSN